jgi:MFS family permease
MQSMLKWHVVIGGFLAYMFDAVEISILAISLPSIRAVTKLTLFEGGLLATISWIGIGVSGLVMGVVADNYGRRRALLTSLAVFGVPTFAFAFSSGSFAIMLALRFVAGLGLGGVWAILAAYVAETWPSRSRGRVTLLVLSSYPVGAACAAAVGGMFLPDWQKVFMYCGAAAIVPFLYVLVFIPESPAWLADRLNRSATTRSETQRHQVTPLREIFRGELLRQTLFGTAAATFALFAYIGLLTWLPSYLTVERGLPLARVAHYVIVFNVGVFASYFIFGFVADALGERVGLLISLLGVAVMLLIYSMVTDVTVLLWLSPFMGVFIVFSGLLGSYFSRIYPIHIRATGAGFCFNVGRGVASLSPVITASIATTQGLSSALTVCAGIFLLSAVAVFCLPRTGTRTELSAASLEVRH